MKKFFLAFGIGAVLFVGAEVPFSIIRFGTDLTNPGRWEAARDLLIRNRSVCDEVWFSTGSAAASPAFHRENAARQKKAAAEFRAAGIVPSLQVQETVGHEEPRTRLAKLPHAATWTGLTGPDGYEATRCWCPRDPAFQAHVAAVVRLYAEWKPGSVWIDDDLRLDRHGRVSTGCYCRRCLETFSRREGRTFSRESLLAALKSDAALTARWREHGFRALAALAAAVVRAVRAVSPDTRVGLQYPWSDKEQLLICEEMAKAAGGKIGIRPGSGAYLDRNPFEQVGKTYRLARQLKRLSGKPELFDQICPEIETCPRLFSSRTPRSLAFEALIHLAQGCDSLSWYMIGGEDPASFDEWIFPALRENMALFKAYVRLNAGTVPCGFDVADVGDAPDAPFWPAGYAASGVPYACGGGRKIGVAISAALVGRLSDGEIRKFFAGPVVTDRKGVAALQARGLLTKAIRGDGRYGLPEGGRLGVFYALSPDEASAAEIVRYGLRADWATKGGLPALLLDPALAAMWCRVRQDGTFASLVLLNTRIDEQKPVRVRLRRFPGETAVWYPLWGAPVTCSVVRDETGDAVVTLPAVGAWSGGFLAPASNGQSPAFTGTPAGFRPSDVPGGNRGMMLRSWDVREDDIRTLASWGGNLARYQMSVGWGKVDANRDPKAFQGWIDENLAQFDRVLAWGGKYGVRFVLDLHVPPGGRDEKGEMHMFHDKKYADLFVATWRRIARRYGADPRIYGYDLINEPTNRKKSPEGLDWWSLQVAAARAVLQEAPGARVIIESNEWAQPRTFDRMKPVPFTNVVYQVHVYTPKSYTHQGTGLKDAEPPGSLAWPDAEKGWNRDWLRERLRPVREFQLRHGARIYVGEFSASVWAVGAENYLRDCIALFKEYDWDWTYHALRESKSWNVELAPDANGKLVPAFETPRKQVLMKGLEK